MPPRAERLSVCRSPVVNVVHMSSVG
jgi:hypothetical protein